MKLYDNAAADANESTDSLDATNSFKMANTPHMFRILSNGLYADKISAVIREIACNAVDAHIMEGKASLPIEVKLPTIKDKTFHVRDWGPGLGDAEIRELYTTYGWSSKQQSEDTTGGFGLGSKSPFAYTTSSDTESNGFTVVSVHKGIKRVYTCFLTDAGEPAISRMLETPADDPNWQHGVLVTFQVDSADISEFHQKAVEIFRWFAVAPKVINLGEGGLNVPEYKIRGKFYGLGLTNPSESRQTRSFVITGGVRYPIEADKLKDLSKTHKDVLYAGVDLYLPLGSVLMQPSREGLQYTARTTGSIISALTDMLAELGNEMKAAFTDRTLLPWAWLKKMNLSRQSLKSVTLDAHFLPLLLAAGAPAEEVEKYGKLMVTGAVQIPATVGEGPSEDPRVDHSRVWMYKKSGSDILKSEVVRGYLGADTTSPSTAFLDCTTESVVLYADCKHADARVKDFMRSSDVSVALLVAHGRVGKTAGYPTAKAYAESIGDSEDLKGIPVLALGTATADFEVVKRQRQVRVTLPAAERFANELVKVCTPSSGAYPAEQTLGTIVESSDKYYVLSTNLDRLTRGTVSNDGFSAQISGYSVDRQLAAIRKVADFLGCPINNVVVLRAEGTARRLKLQEQGFKPLFPHMAKLLKEAEAAERFESLADALTAPTARFNLKEIYVADDFELMGLVAHYCLTNSPQWKEIREVFTGTEFLPLVDDFISRLSDTAISVVTPELAEKQKVLAALADVTWLCPIKLVESRKVPTSGYETREQEVKRFTEKYPLTSGFKVDFLIKNLGNKNFLPLLKQAMIADKLITKHVPAFAGLSKWSAS